MYGPKEIRHLLREHEFYLQVLMVPQLNNPGTRPNPYRQISIKNTEYKIYLLKETTWLQDNFLVKDEEDIDYSGNQVAKEELLESAKVLFEQLEVGNVLL